MTALLARAFETASALPDSLQDEIARQLLAEVEWEKAWNKESENKDMVALDDLALQALAEFKAGKTSEAHWDGI